MSPRPPKEEVRIGISACLLGQAVRYDGRHKEHLLVTRALSAFMTFVPVCPEVEAGMGVPRPPVRLVRVGRKTRVLDPANGVDHTESLRAFSRARVGELAALDLSGYILKKDLKSCMVIHCMCELRR